jgi:hypothetical protein
MTRAVLYMAHALRPSEDEIKAQESILAPDRTPDRAIEMAYEANIRRSMRWLTWLRRSFPETTFIAPWIAAVQSGEDDSDTAQRESGLVDACAVIERCDGIVLCGGRISMGMRREMEHGTKRDEEDRVPFEVYDLTRWSMIDPGPPLRPAIDFAQWYSEFGS